MFHHNFTLKTSSYSWLLFFRLRCNHLYTIVCKLYEYISRGYRVGDGSDRGSWGCFLADLVGGSTGYTRTFQMCRIGPASSTVGWPKMKEKRSALEGFWECYHWMYLVMRVTPETRMPLSDHYRMTIFFRRFHVSDLHVSLTSIGGGSHLKLCPIFLLVVSRNNQPHQMGRGWLNLQGLCN